MKISIITVCYNSENTIEDTLKSVLSQTYKNYEYLIIDGKSTDNTLSIIDSYKEKFEGKMRVVSEKDKGLFDAMNKGIKLSSGDIIGIINSDDVLAHENVFKSVIDNIDGYDGVYSDLLMLDEYLIKPYRLMKYGEVSRYFGWHMPHPTLYLKKEVYKDYGCYDIKYKVSADLDLMYRLINKKLNFKYVEDYYVYMRSGGASTNGIRGYYENFKESYKVLKNNNRFFPLITNCIRTICLLFEKMAIFRKKEIYKSQHVSNKPKYIQINTVCNGSTGKSMRENAKQAINDGYQVLCIYGRRKGYKDLRCIKLNTLFDCQGLHASYFCTKRIINILRKENPDIIHLHNIHGYYLNYPVLFKYLRDEYKGEVKWTFHDCWPITGHCAHFTLAKCNKWEKKCYKCPNTKKYPISLLFDNSMNNYKNKKKWFTSVNNLTIITPSNWMKNIVCKSFMGKYDIVTINNTIDTNIFKPTKDDSVFKKYSLPLNKRIIIGVSGVW